ncbi:TetR/AcrR family transcriptional regulator [Streptomyces sp. NPDC055078]
MPPRRDPKKHDEVLDAAIMLIRQKGIEGTSLQDVADAVKLKKGSLITYFSSKAELTDLIQARFTKIAELELAEIAERLAKDPEHRLRELLQFHAEHCTLNMSSPVLVSFMQLWSPPGTPTGQKQLEIRRQYQSVFEQAVVECSRKRIFKKVDTELVVNGLMGTMSWCAFWYDEETHGPLRPLVDGLIDMAFVGLRPRPRRTPAARK